MTTTLDDTQTGTRPDPLRSALRTLATETAGLTALSGALESTLSEPFASTVMTLREVPGRVIVSGMGKSGHIARKVAATLSSTGTPAYFVHPAEASHGDLGMVTPDDAIICLSWSGEAVELGGIISYARRFAIPLVAVTAGGQSALAREADIVLLLPRSEEACPHGLAPTTSALMQLAIGDALAVALLEARGFTASQFHNFHPGGKLGANLTRVGDIMHTGERIPLVRSGASMRDAIVQISQKGFGCVGVIARDGRLDGIITDGDLRRHIDADLLSMKADEVMTRTPKTIEADALAAAALTIVNEQAITALMIVESDRPVGIVHLHDLLRLGVA